MKTLKEKLLNCEKVCGTHISMRDSAIADIFSMVDFDFIWIDTEHSPIDYGNLLDDIAIIKAKGKEVLVRVQIDNYNHTKKVLEMGPSGVVFPMINTKEQAEKAIASTFYPPEGNRGIGAHKGANYGEIDAVTLKKNEDKLIRCIQIETKQAVDNIEELVKVKGVDCFVFGLWDLSFDLGDIGNIFGEKELPLIKKVIKTCREHGKSVGVSYGGNSVEFIKKFNDLGINFISCGQDFEYLHNSAKQNLENVRKIQQN